MAEETLGDDDHESRRNTHCRRTRRFEGGKRASRCGRETRVGAPSGAGPSVLTDQNYSPGRVIRQTSNSPAFWASKPSARSRTLPTAGLARGDSVATAMGGMGRAFDGGYAEYTLVPTSQVQKINTSLGWDQFGALPEMIQTAWGSLNTALGIERGETLLVRGGTTSVGLAAAVLAKQRGLTVGGDDAKTRSSCDASGKRRRSRFHRNGIHRR